MHRHMWGRVAHSLYFTLLPELGILGVIVFVYLLRLFYLNNKSVLKSFPKKILVLRNSQNNEDESDEYQREKFFHRAHGTLRVA